MKLTELEPKWVATDEPRHGMGISFNHPNGKDFRLVIWFDNPIDGGKPAFPNQYGLWHRTGEDFETLTLTPSIEVKLPEDMYWHGFLTNGDFKSV